MDENDLNKRLVLSLKALRASCEWRMAVARAEAALAHAADVHQGIEPGSTKAEHRKVTVLELEARAARDRYDAAFAQITERPATEREAPPRL